MATTVDAEILEETPHQPTLKPIWDETCESFDGLNLREELLKGVYAYGFERPSSIQQLALVPMIGVPRAWPLLGTSADAALHWSPLVHRKAQRAVVMTVLLIGERLRRCCDREWDEVEMNPLAGLEDTLPNEVWLEILGMASQELSLLHNGPSCTPAREH